MDTSQSRSAGGVRLTRLRREPGGIQTWQDAAEFILAGATGLGIGTALFVDPNTGVSICDGLSKYLEKMKVERLTDLVGALQLPGDQAPPVTPYP